MLSGASGSVMVSRPGGIKAPWGRVDLARGAVLDLIDRQRPLVLAVRREAEDAHDPGKTGGFGQARGGEGIAAALGAGFGDQRADGSDPVKGEASERMRITPEAAFSVTEWSAFVIFIVVIGGLGTIEGPIIGVILFFLLRDLAADLGTWYLIGLGALAIAVMLIDRRGIWGALKARGAPALFKTQRQLK